MTWKSNNIYFIKLGISVLLIVLLFYSVEFSDLYKAISQSNRNLMILGLFLFVSQGIFESARLKVVFSTYGIKYLEAAHLFFIGVFFSNFMPGSLGADIYQIHYMNKLRSGIIRPISLSLLLRLCGVIMNVIVGIIALYVCISDQRMGQLVEIDYKSEMIIPVVTVILFIILAVFIITSIIKRDLVKKISDKFYELLDDLMVVLKTSLNHQLAALFVYGLLVIASRAISLMVVALAFGHTLNLSEVLLVVTITTLVTLLPISFAGLGVREVSSTAILIAFGVPSADALAISLVTRCYVWILSLVGGGWFVIDSKLIKESV